MLESIAGAAMDMSAARFSVEKGDGHPGAGRPGVAGNATGRAVHGTIY
mgnify:CR=1 FL=1